MFDFPKMMSRRKSIVILEVHSIRDCLRRWQRV
ncbi:MAG: hypothetical protein ACI89J_002514, partial [Hyphomicrobiaceae bacterium]